MSKTKHLELLNKALARDASAVRELVSLLSPVVQARVARALVQRASGGRSVRQEVEDLTQEVFLALFADDSKALRAWQPERGLSLQNFVGLLAQRQAISILRSGKRSPWRDDPSDMQVMEAVPEPRQQTETRVASRQVLGRLLDRVRESLSPQGLELFYRLLVREEPVEQVRDQTGMSAAAIYAWRSRLGKLARRLAHEIEHEDTSRTAPVSDRGKTPRIPQVQGDR